MKRPRVDVGSVRREQVIAAAIAVIAEQGVQHLSLSEIEKRAGMSRGQLTYYFPAKEDILLAVFDRLVQMIRQRVESGGEGGGCGFDGRDGLARLEVLLQRILLEPPAFPELHALHYTFLSQIGHRDDFRARLANLYEEWRRAMAAGVAECLPAKGLGGVSPRTLASFVQALAHGLRMQRAADPQAFDPREMFELCAGVLRGYLRPPAPNGKASRRKGPRPGRAPRGAANGTAPETTVNHA
jgi:AcrR family transcriptional regulator